MSWRYNLNNNRLACPHEVLDTLPHVTRSEWEQIAQWCENANSEPWYTISGGFAFATHEQVIHFLIQWS
jgi:hypothetical protein